MCNCKLEKPEPTEDELIQRAQYKVRAHEEIAEMLLKKSTN